MLILVQEFIYVVFVRKNRKISNFLFQYSDSRAKLSILDGVISLAIQFLIYFF